MLKALIFDLDGTLCDSLPLCIEAFRRACGTFLDKPLNDKEILATFGPSDEGTIKLLAKDHYDEAFALFLQYYRELHPALCPKPFDGIAALIEDLKCRGLRIGLVTGKGRKSLDITLDELHIRYLFDAFEAGSPLGPNKPNCLRSILQTFNLLPAEAVYIGDMASDILACRQVPMPVWSAAWAATADAEKLKAHQPDKIFYSVQELRSELQTYGRPESGN
ncbi:MAG: HAD family hydrolase [Planctomycetaceae bacterium]|jgi:phosphoglycolate phosphatase/pyrophosphatase PpaX|nr:HAD family hydrolase [Planctomycetaceae bacterium]